MVGLGDPKGLFSFKGSIWCKSEHAEAKLSLSDTPALCLLQVVGALRYTIL